MVKPLTNYLSFSPFNNVYEFNVYLILLIGGAGGGIMGWTARAGSFVVEKMNIFSYTESVPNTSIIHKQPSFLERCVSVHDTRNLF